MATKILASLSSNTSDLPQYGIADLEQESSLLRNLLENLPDSIYFKDAHSRFVLINRALARRLGLSDPAEAIGKTDADFFAADHADQAAADERQLMTSGEAVLYKEELETWPDGRSAWVATTKLPLRDDSGKIIGTFGVSRDITMRKHMEDALRQSENRIRLILDSAHDAFIAMDATGLIIDWNARAEELFGWTRAEVLGKTVEDTVIPPRYRLAHRAGLQKFLATGEGPVLNQRIEITACRKNGEEFPVELTISPIRWQQTYLFSAFIHDISARVKAQAELHKAKEAAEAASRAKSEFLANMSHEIRTPMNGILGMTELALDTQLTPEQREYLGMVKASADSLLSVINDILDFSKIEARRMQLEALEFPLRDALGDAMRALALRAQQRKLELVCHISPDVPDDLVGDPMRLRQVIVNLVGNAIKFTTVGEVALHVERVSQAGREVELHFAVADTGIGIPHDKQQVIFEAFSQVDASTTRKFGGTGLGLAISSELIELMGGRLWLESVVGQGSTFHFTARFRLAESPPQARHLLPTANLHQLQVLVVDDNATNLRILQEMLTNWGMCPVVTRGAAEAMAAVASAAHADQTFSLVLLDGHMPETDGFTLAAQMRGDPRLVGTTIIMLTSAGQSEDIARCRELGIKAYLMKPIKQSELLDAIFTSLGASLREPDAPPAAPLPPLPSLTVLLAEDNPVNQKLAARLLEKQGHKVVVAADGVEALAAAGSQHFDLVLMDVQMPELDGFEATTEIRARERLSGRHTPIVAMTAHAMKGDRERCLAVGMDGYLSKPIQPHDLFNTIAAVLANQPADNAAEPAAAVPLEVFHSGAALESVDGDVELLRELIAVFLETYPTHVAGMQEAIDRNDAQALQNLAHTMKGAVGTFGAKLAYDAALRLETLGRSHELAHAPQALAAMTQSLEKLRQVLVQVQDPRYPL